MVVTVVKGLNWNYISYLALEKLHGNIKMNTCVMYLFKENEG